MTINSNNSRPINTFEIETNDVGQTAQLQMELDRYRHALSVANAEIERRNRNTIALTTFAYRANRVTNLDTLLKLALLQALDNTAAPVGAVILINSETGHLDLGFRKGLTQAMTDILTGHSFDESATALMPHLVSGTGALLESHNTDDSAEQRLLEAGQLSSLASFPLVIGKRLMGAFLVGLQDERAFRSSELSFLMAISQATAIAIENLHLRERLWRVAEVFLEERPPDDGLSALNAAPLKSSDSLSSELVNMGLQMGSGDELQQQNIDLQIIIALSEMINRSLNMAEILQCAVDQTRVILNTDAAWLYIVEEGDTLKLRAHVGLSKNYVHGMRSLHGDDSLEGEAFFSNQPNFVNSIETRARKIWVDKEGIQAIAVVPITRHYTTAQHASLGWEVMGVLATGMRGTQPYDWTIHEMDLLSAIANQVALAVDKAQSYANIQQKETSLKGSNDILREVNDMLLEKTGLFETFIEEELQPALTKVTGLLRQFDPDHLTPMERKHLSVVQETIQEIKKASHITLNS